MTWFVTLAVLIVLGAYWDKRTTDNLRLHIIELLEEERGWMSTAEIIETVDRTRYAIAKRQNRLSGAAAKRPFWWDLLFQTGTRRAQRLLDELIDAKMIRERSRDGSSTARNDVPRLEYRYCGTP